MDKKIFMVSVDLVVSTEVYVEASDEDYARIIASARIEKDPYNFVRNGRFTCYYFTDCDESFDEV